MIHLFEKTYLELETFIQLSEQRFVISETSGHPLDYILDKMHPNKHLGNGTSIADIIGEGKQFATVEDLFLFCLNKNIDTTKRVIIYCDKSTLITLACYWFKTVFANIDASSAHTIIKTDLIKGAFWDKSGHKSFYRDSIPTLEEVTTVFNGTTVDTESEKNIELFQATESSRSIEYAMASYLFNGSKAESVRKSLEFFMGRKIQGSLLSMKLFIQQGSLNPDLTKFFTDQEMSLDNILAVTSSEFFIELEAAVNRQLDFKNLTEAQHTQLKATLQMSIDYQLETQDVIENPCIRMSIEYLDYFYNGRGLSLSDLDEVITKSFSINDFIHRFWDSQDFSNVNLFLFEIFRRNKITGGDVSLLQPYLLR